MLPVFVVHTFHCKAFQLTQQKMFSMEKFLTAYVSVQSTTICFLNPYKIYRKLYIERDMMMEDVCGVCVSVCSLETKEPLHFCLPSHFILVSLNLPTYGMCVYCSTENAYSSYQFFCMMVP